jgi:hypothetical protein
MTCAEYRELVAADADGALGSDVEAAVQHRASCSSCMRLFEQQVSIRDLLRLRPLEPPAPIGLRTRIVAHLEEESRRRAAPWWRLWVRWAGAALIVACAAAVWIVSTRDGWFTPLIESYDLASRGALRIAFPTSAPAALEAYYRQYHQEGFPEHVVDLSPKGFHLHWRRASRLSEAQSEARRLFGWRKLDRM